MALLKNLFSSKLVANNDVIPVEANDEQDVNNGNQNLIEEPVDEENKKKLITIAWGTGMPIDIIFNYIHKNFEEDGFQDALVNNDITYRDAKEKIIRNDLEMLFKRIILRYKKDIREIEVDIDNALKAYAFVAASRLQSQRDTYEEHLTEINEMQQMLQVNDPQMTTMIESYRRGFLKGVTSRAINYIENK